MSPKGIERPQTYALDSAATTIGIHVLLLFIPQSRVFSKIAQSNAAKITTELGTYAVFFDR
jgi:hypothetical protein